MSRSSEAHSYLSSDAASDTVDVLLQTVATLIFFGNDVETIEQIESVAKQGLVRCQVWYIDEYATAAQGLAEVLKGQGFSVESHDHVLVVSWIHQLASAIPK